MLILHAYLSRPITAYGALELPTYTLDVTPFLPLLTDGNPHNFTIDVVSAEANHTINQNWYVSGLLQVVTDVSDKPTTGKIISHTVEPFARATIVGGVSDGDVDFTVKATRQIRVESQIISGSGKSTHVVWSQDLEFSNTQSYQGNATYQVILSSFEYIVVTNLETQIVPQPDCFWDSKVDA